MVWPPRWAFVDGDEDAWDRNAASRARRRTAASACPRDLHREGLPPSLVRLLPAPGPGAVVALGPRDDEELAPPWIPQAETILMRKVGELQAHPHAPWLYDREATDRILTGVGRWWLHLGIPSTEAPPSLPAAPWLDLA